MFQKLEWHESRKVGRGRAHRKPCRSTAGKARCARGVKRGGTSSGGLLEALPDLASGCDRAAPLTPSWEGILKPQMPSRLLKKPGPARKASRLLVQCSQARSRAASSRAERGGGLCKCSGMRAGSRGGGIHGGGIHGGWGGITGGWPRPPVVLVTTVLGPIREPAGEIPAACVASCWSRGVISRMRSFKY